MIWGVGFLSLWRISYLSWIVAYVVLYYIFYPCVSCFGPCIEETARGISLIIKCIAGYFCVQGQGPNDVLHDALLQGERMLHWTARIFRQLYQRSDRSRTWRYVLHLVVTNVFIVSLSLNQVVQNLLRWFIFHWSSPPHPFHWSWRAWLHRKCGAVSYVNMKLPAEFDCVSALLLWTQPLGLQIIIFIVTSVAIRIFTSVFLLL